MKNAIVTGGTKNNIDYMAVLALNIKDVSPNLGDELVILHDGVPANIRDKINTIMPVRFIKYNCPVSKLKLITNPTVRYFSPMVFSKIECFRLLKEYDNVTWVDYDMLLKTDVSDLLIHDNNYNLIMNHDYPFKEMLHKGYEKLKLDEKYDLNHPSMVAALFSLRRDETVDYDKWCDWYYDRLLKYRKYLYLPEQVLITLMLQEFDVKYNEIDELIYNVYPTKDSESAKILHSYGQQKFWKGIDNAKWNEYSEEWQRIKMN